MKNDIHSHVHRLRAHRAMGALAVGALASTLAAAQTSSVGAPPGEWHYSATLYGYLPSLGGSSSIPVDSGTPINVSVDQIIDALKFTVMGSFAAHNGRWGLFTDVIYLNLGGDKQQTRDFTIGNVGLPATTTADIGLDLKGLVWTLGGEYRVVSDPGLTIDAVFGARLLDLRQTTRWSISGDLGPIAPAGRSGTSEHKISNWDGIVGASGRVALGSERRWSVPFYADVGTGQSDLTWQVAAGISYAYPWGEISAKWRYLAYEMKSGKVINDLNFNGPMFGATVRW